MYFKTSFLLAVLSFLSIGLNAQNTYTMKDTTVTECDGIHTDSDAKAFPAGQYNSNEDFTFTICPGTGATVYYTFTSFFTESLLDTLTFFDGPNRTSPSIAQFSGNLNSSLPPTIVATSGCLTIHFKSDAVLEFPGWVANWNSTAPIILAPTVDVSSLAPPTCDSNFFIVEFDKKLHCDSVISKASASILGFNAPTVTSISPMGCANDSSKFARITLSTPFFFNCEYELIMDVGLTDICDSLYNFTIRDTFNFNTCELTTQLSSTNDSLCYGDCAILNINSSLSCNTYSYSWSNGLPNTMGPHSVCPSSTTTYYVTVTESNSGQTYTDSITIKVLDTLPKIIDITTVTSEAPECNDRFFIVRLSPAINCNLLDSVIFSLTSTAGNFTVTDVFPLNCNNNKLDSVRLRLDKIFVQNCDYLLDFDLNFTDSCEGLISINSKDTFQIIDCPFSLTTQYTDTICENTCTNVTAIVSGCSGYTYLWSNGLPNSAGPFNICPTGDTTFYLQVTEISTGLILNDTVVINIINPTINPVVHQCSYNSPFNLTAVTSGGTWSGTGITNSTTGFFNPSIAGAGSHTITYQFGACQDTILIEVTNPNARGDRNLCASGIPVNLNNGLPTGGIWSGVNVNSVSLTFTPIVFGNFTAYYTVNGCVDSINITVDTIAFTYNTDTLCGSSLVVTIPVLPAGGNWSGPGITSGSLGVFDPSIANSGGNLVNYFYKGCRDTVNMVVINVSAGTDSNACPSQTPFNVANGIPSSGTWSGIGITPTGLFNPSTTPGNWVSNLVFTNSGCTDTMIMSVTQTNIIPDTVYVCPSQDSLEINAIPSLLKEPNFGTWSGIGTQTHSFVDYIYPRILGNGYHTIYYDKNTCQDSVIVAIYPDTLSYIDTTICSLYAPFLIDATNNMPGVTWQGPGITNTSTGLFDPSVAGIGTHQITFTTQGNICNKIISVTVYQFVAAQITLQDTFCFTNSNTIINAIPNGGTWSGTGVYNQNLGIFNPRIANPGRHQIIYTLGSGTCRTSAEKSVFVRDSILTNLTKTSDTICIGSSINLFGSVVGGYPNPAYTYSWAHTGTSGNNLVENPTTTTQYIFTANDGCSDPHSDSTTVVVLSINPNLTASPTKCFGEIGFATFDLTQKSIYNFTWTKPLALGDSIFGIVKDSAYLTITNSFGCSIDTFIEIPGYNYLEVNFSLNPDKFPKCLSSEDKKLVVTDLSIGAIQGLWDFGDATNPIPYNPANISETYLYTKGGNYIVSLIVKNDGPCFDTLTREICVSDEQFFIADIFSPNGDGMNDMLFVRSSEAEKLEFLVFDRWGKLVFESDNVDFGWDGSFKGKQVESGVYFYSVKMTLVDGREILKKGDVTLIR
jgi:gliding motility-associated-like protein